MGPFDFSSLRPNVYEQLAQERKAGKIVASIPCGRTERENQLLADALEKMDSVSRAQFSIRITGTGCSATTWEIVVGLIRGRVIIDQEKVFANMRKGTKR